MTLAEFEKYAKEHNIFYCTKELGEQIKVETPPILEQIRAEILDTFLWENETEENLNDSVRKCLEIIEKYAEQAKGGE